MLKNGIATENITLTLYNYDAKTRELTFSDKYLILSGSGLPANTTEISPHAHKSGFSQIFDGKKWEYISDYRRETAYNTTTKLPVIITQLGDIPDDLTLLEPFEFCMWDEKIKNWVVDENQKNTAMIQKNESIKNLLLATSNEKITILQDAIDLDMCESNESEQLNQWRKFRILIARVDTNQLDIEWPKQPE